MAASQTKRFRVINLNEAWELKYWSEALGVSRSQLKSAVRAVGPLAHAVRQYLVGMK